MYDDVRIGTISIRSGVPVGVDQCGWSCDFVLALARGRERGRHRAELRLRAGGLAAAWPRLLPNITEAHLTENGRKRAMTAWKYRMRGARGRLPTQELAANRGASAARRSGLRMWRPTCFEREPLADIRIRSGREPRPSRASIFFSTCGYSNTVVQGLVHLLCYLIK